MVTTAPFELDFTLDAKAELHEQDDGTVFIEGYASDFGLDRQNEAFEDGAFQKSMETFMATNPVLLYHHHFDQALGQIVDYQHRRDGMWVKARVDPAEPGTILADVVRKIKTGAVRGFSVGGKFHRRKADGKTLIHTADIMEISVTPTPVNPRTLFAVAGKAFEGDDTLARLEKLSNTFDVLLEQAEQ